MLVVNVGFNVKSSMGRSMCGIQLLGSLWIRRSRPLC